MPVLKTSLALLFVAVALSGCGDGAADSVGGVSPSEAKALNDAAEMLDERAANSATPLPAAS